VLNNKISSVCFIILAGVQSYSDKLLETINKEVEARQSGFKIIYSKDEIKSLRIDIVSSLKNRK
jgi:hypothetical protein